MTESTEMATTMRAVWEESVSFITEYGIGVLGATLTLIIGWKIASTAQRLLKRALAKTDYIDAMLEDFLASLLRYAILAVTLIAVLDQFGVETTSLVAVFGAAGLAVGLALQGTLSHVAAGVMLLILRPFKVGDYVDCAGLAGTVKSVTLFITRLETADKLEIIVPNGDVWGRPITNFSHNPDRRLDLVIGIDYGDDIGLALSVLEDLARAEPRIYADPPPFIHVQDLGDNAVNLLFRVWCGSGDYFVLKCDMTRKIKETFDSRGISFPFPQRTVHLAKTDVPIENLRADA